MLLNSVYYSKEAYLPECFCTKRITGFFDNEITRVHSLIRAVACSKNSFKKFDMYYCERNLTMINAVLLTPRDQGSWLVSPKGGKSQTHSTECQKKSILKSNIWWNSIRFRAYFCASNSPFYLGVRLKITSDHRNLKTP